MTRQFKTIADAVPVFAVINPPFSMDEKTAEPMFTAAETAQLMRMIRVEQENLCCAKMGSEAEKIAALKIVILEAKMAEWEKNK